MCGDRIIISPAEVAVAAVLSVGPTRPGTRDRWFSRESRRPREWRGPKCGPEVVGPPRRAAGMLSPGAAPWLVGRLWAAVGVGLRVSGGSGRAMEGVRGWTSALQMVRASEQNEET